MLLAFRKLLKAKRSVDISAGALELNSWGELGDRARH
jgi:hypothetical protein